MSIDGIHEIIIPSALPLLEEIAEGPICTGVRYSIFFWLRTYSKKKGGWDFPGNPMVKTLSFQCRGCRFDPWWGN